MKASEYKQSMSPARHICVYGAPKTGKTELIGALAQHYKLWVLDLDGGGKTWFKDTSPAAKYLDNIEYFRLPDTQLMPIGIETVLKVIKGGACNICYDHGKVDCPKCKAANRPSASINVSTFDTAKDILVIDPYSQVMDSAINHIKKDSIQKDDFSTEWADWRKQGGISDRICSTIQNAPFNVIITSHEILSPQEDGTKKISPIGGTRNFSTDFGKYFDDIVYCDLLAGKYRAFSDAGDKTRIVIGSRTGKKLQDEKGNQLGLIELFK